MERNYVTVTVCICCVMIYVFAAADWEVAAAERRPLPASVSDVASATTILLAVCLLVLLTLTAICRLLRRGTYHVDHPGGHLGGGDGGGGYRCADGAGCAGAAAGGPDADDRCRSSTAQLPEDQSAVTLTNDRRCSSTSHRSLSMRTTHPPDSSHAPGPAASLHPSTYAAL